MVKVRNYDSQKGRSAINIVEEALCVLRNFPETLAIYYIGSLPFILGILYFWADMSQGAYEGHHALGAAFILAILYIGMKSCHVYFSNHVYSKISQEPTPHRSLSEHFSLITTQALIQSSLFLVWPFALFLILPFGWVFPFYHYTSIIQESSGNFKVIWDKSWELAKQWPGQNYILILLTTLFYIVIFINVAAAIFIIPQLLKSFLGIDSVFVLSGVHFLNTTFLSIAFSVTYLIVNPIIKTAYVIRYFDWNSIQFGNDIKANLNSFKLHKQIGLMVLMIILIPSINLWAGETNDLETKTTYQSLTLGALNSSIDRVLSEREFAWRMPRGALHETKIESSNKDSVGWFSALMSKIRPVLRKIAKVFRKWLKELSFLNGPDEPDDSKNQLLKMNKTLYTLIIVMTVLLGSILIIVWKRKKQKTVIEQLKPVKPMDITSDNIKADDLLLDQWLNMANHFLREGDLRHAVRAYYLGTLSHLAKTQMITIKSYKSNYEYELEIRRHARENPQLCEVFSQTIAFFNSVWYGDRSLKIQQVEEFYQLQEKIIQLAHA